MLWCGAGGRALTDSGFTPHQLLASCLLVSSYHARVTLFLSRACVYGTRVRFPLYLRPLGSDVPAFLCPLDIGMDIRMVRGAQCQKVIDAVIWFSAM